MRVPVISAGASGVRLALRTSHSARFMCLRTFLCREISLWLLPDQPLVGRSEAMRREGLLNTDRRAPRNRRSCLFLPGAERIALENAVALGADVLIQELEDFTPPDRRHEARAMAASVL